MADLALSTDHYLDAELHQDLAESLERLERYARDHRAANTKRAYEADLRDFADWCERYDRSPLPASVETVGLYVGALAAENKLATIERRLAAISVAHKEAGYDSPASVAEQPLRRIWEGLVREKSRVQDKAEPLLVADLKRIVETLPRQQDGELSLRALRDRALLLVGWSAALRRSELVGITSADVDWIEAKGMNVTITRSKTDQHGEGLVKGIPFGNHADTCPVLALRTWLRRAGISDGPVFRRLYRGGSVGESGLTPQSVSLVVKRHVERVGLDPAIYSSHSLRSGFITQALYAGRRERRVKEHSGHKSWAAFNQYVKKASTFQENPAKDIGL